MGKVTGFLEYDRQEQKYQLAGERVRHFREFTLPLDDNDLKKQAGRCMDCGIPFCHGPTGCPVHNQIPDWNDLVWSDDWEEAARNLHTTNNFPEFTGRICPAPCEEACTLNLENQPVTIKTIEQAIADKAWEMGFVKPEPAEVSTGKRVAVIGSGPAGLAAAQQLARAGHEVHVFERQAKPGGLLRYGIPDFKMEKYHIDRRVKQMEAEGVVFHCGVNVGVDKSFASLHNEFDAVLFAGGAEDPRNPNLPGQDLAGVYYAMPYLTQSNQRMGSEEVTDEPILASGKHVVVIGGGDTASDCVGTAFRQGALSVTQLDIRPKPARAGGQADGVALLADQDAHLLIPGGRRRARVPGGDARASRARRAASSGVHCARVDEKRQPIPGIGVHPQGRSRLPRHRLCRLGQGRACWSESGVAMDRRGNVVADDRSYRTSSDKVFVAGDMRRGQSLVVWAIREGRQAARSIDIFLTGSSILPA